MKRGLTFLQEMALKNLSGSAESRCAHIRVDAEESLAARLEQSGDIGAASGNKDALTAKRGSTVAGIPVISPASSSISESSAPPAQSSIEKARARKNRWRAKNQAKITANTKAWREKNK